MIPTIMVTKILREARKPRNPVPRLKTPRAPAPRKLRMPGWLNGLLKRCEATEYAPGIPSKPFDADSDNPDDWCTDERCICGRGDVNA